MDLKAFIKLIRLDNLLVIALTMYAVRYGMVEAILNAHSPSVQLKLSALNFSLLVASTMLIAAAGYIINDYFDVKTDKINKPDKLYIDHGVKRRVAMLAHMQFNLIGVMLGAYVAYRAGNIFLSFIPFAASTLLWFYSTHFKRQLLIGNVVVSALSGMIPLQVLLFEKPLIENIENLTFLYATVICFAVFAFLLSMAREIIKDMEDFEGDLETGCKTMPVVWGMKAAKAVTTIFISNTMLLLFFIFFKLYQRDFLLLALYLWAFILVPCVWLVFRLYRAQAKADFSKLSLFTKFIMVAGVLSTVVIYLYCHGYNVNI